MPEPRFSIVVPLFNEQFAVAGTIVDIRDYFERRGESYEILLVDNASTDATRSHAQPLLDGEKVRLLVNDANLGKGFSVRRGMLDARGEIRLHCDADCAPSLASLPKMLELLERNDLVVGSRLAAGAELGQRQTLPRRFVGRGFQQCCRAILSEPTRDLFWTDREGSRLRMGRILIPVIRELLAAKAHVRKQAAGSPRPTADEADR